MPDWVQSKKRCGREDEVGRVAHDHNKIREIMTYISYGL